MNLGALLGRRFTRAAATLLLCAAPLLATAQTVTFFHNDAAGTPLLATDAAGAVVWKESYQPYGGKLNNQPAASGNRIGFAGKPFDNVSGLSYAGARYYDPVLGRFMGIDPAAVEPGSVHGFNRYAYANNNPHKYVDPDGRSPLDVAFLVYDIGKLGVAIYSGVGVGAAAADVALSVVGVASPVPGVGQALKAAKAAHAVEQGVGAARAGRATEVAKYEVGKFGDLAKRSSGDGLEVHHAAQKHPAGQVIAGYDAKNGPSIVLPSNEHRRIPTIKGDYSGSPRDLLAKDIRDLRNNTNAPNSSIRDLVQRNKDTYPDAFAK